MSGLRPNPSRQFPSCAELAQRGCLHGRVVLDLSWPYANAEIRRQPPEILAPGVWRENTEGRCEERDRVGRRTPGADRTGTPGVAGHDARLTPSIVGLPRTSAASEDAGGRVPCRSVHRTARVDAGVRSCESCALSGSSRANRLIGSRLFVASASPSPSFLAGAASCCANAR